MVYYSLVENKKLKTIKELQEIVKDLKAKGKTVGLITGCFDLIHAGHIKLFRFAKTKVDYLIVGLDNDQTVKLSKGLGRPVCSFSQRAEVLQDLQSVNFIFKIPKVIDFNSESDDYYFQLTKKLAPTTLLTVKSADKFWERKKKRAESLKMKFVSLDRPEKLSSTILAKYRL